MYQVPGAFFHDGTVRRSSGIIFHDGTGRKTSFSGRDRTVRYDRAFFLSTASGPAARVYGCTVYGGREQQVPALLSGTGKGTDLPGTWYTYVLYVPGTYIKHTYNYIRRARAQEG